MNSIVAEKRYISNKLGMPYESLSQSYLQSSTLLVDPNASPQVNNVIDFTLQTNKVLNPMVTDRLLDLNDSFVITHFFVGLKSVEVSPDEDLLNPVLTSDQSRVDFFDPATTSLHRSCGAIYNGSLNFTIDRTEFIPQFPVRGFYRVGDALTDRDGDRFDTIPSTEPRLTSDTGSARVGSDNSQLYGFYPCEPTKIDGRQTLDLSINLGTNVNISSEEPYIYAVFEARGYLITNAND